MKQRSTEPEIMDDLELSGSELEATLQTIERVNRFLGGSRNVTNVIDSLLPLNPNPTILDAGCGSGDILRELQSRFGQNNAPVQLVGLDANTHILDYARAHSEGITFLKANIFDHIIPHPQATVVLCSLFLHHFTDQQIVNLLRQWKSAGVHAILINDLQRGHLPLLLFRCIAFLFRFPPMARYDGSLSIRKGFRKNELRTLAKEAGYNAIEIRPVWAFRYRMILKNEQL